MKNINHLYSARLMFIILCLTLVMSACSSPADPSTAPEVVREVQPTNLVEGAATPNITLITAVPMPTRDPNKYPEDAEGVVIAFLTAYQSDQEGMEKYLSKAMRKKVPEGGPGMLLQFRDVLEGYGVTSVAVNQDPAAAVITVAVKVAGIADSTRKFTLHRKTASG
jgi:hypothetical protein